MGLASNTATSGNKPDKISLFKTAPYLKRGLSPI